MAAATTEAGGVTKPGRHRALLARLVWFVGLWAASVLALGVVAYALRLAIRGGS